MKSLNSLFSSIVAFVLLFVLALLFVAPTAKATPYPYVIYPGLTSDSFTPDVAPISEEDFFGAYLGYLAYTDYNIESGGGSGYGGGGEYPWADECCY